MLQELIALEEKFSPYLIKQDYTFIGPNINDPLFDPFIKEVNLKAPVKGWSRSIHDTLSHRESVRATLNQLPAGTALRLYIIPSPELSEGMLMHSTIEEYCKRNNIDFKA